MTDPNKAPDGMRGMRVLGGDELDEMLLYIYLDGFVSGAFSALRVKTEMSDDDIGETAQGLGFGLMEDPIGRAEILAEVYERLAGQDSGGRDVPIMGVDE